MATTQTFSLGTYSDAIRASAERLIAAGWPRRLRQRDPTLWGRDRAVQAQVRGRLGWLDMPARMGAYASEITAAAREAHEAGLRYALLLGMGGSGLFAEVCRETFGAAPGAVDLLVLDSTDPTAITQAERRGPLAHLLLIISSKSGTTSEVAALSRYFYEQLRASGEVPGEHCVVITDSGSPLEAQARSWKCRRLFALGPESGADVGGRFSALTPFGLLPAALLGVEIERLVSSARAMLERCLDPGGDNPAVQLGACLAELAGAGRDTLTLLCAAPLAGIGTWLEQLIAESTGKEGKGIVPVIGEPFLEPSAYPRDRVFLELQLASAVDPVVRRHVEALARAGHPVIRTQWDDRYDLGGDVVQWSIATAIAGALLGVNPFDEPNVQESKDRTRTLLSGYALHGTFPQEAPLLEDETLTVYGTLPGGRPPSLGRCLADFFQERKEGDYVAILSFLPRTSGLDSLVFAIRERISGLTRAATLLSFGPRYLHSIGQLYKGGPDRGLFLLFTAEEPSDLPIPGESYTFGVLKQAQALGDFQAMRERNRRILRVHLGRRPAHGLQRFAESLAGLEVHTS